MLEHSFHYDIVPVYKVLQTKLCSAVVKPRLLPSGLSQVFVVQEICKAKAAVYLVHFEYSQLTPLPINDTHRLFANYPDFQICTYSESISVGSNVQSVWGRWHL